MFMVLRHAAMAVLLVSTLLACSAANNTHSNSEMVETGLKDHSIGNPDAKIHVIEYASITCMHCARFHEETYPFIKERVDAGEVYFTFRELPTPPENVAMAGFLIARCAGEDRYFEVLDDLFTNQSDIFSGLQAGRVRPVLEAVAARHGIAANMFNSCMRNTSHIQAIDDIVSDARALGVTATPTIIINGSILDNYAKTTVLSTINTALTEAKTDIQSVNE